MESRETGQMGYWAGHWPLDPAKPTLAFIHGSGSTRELWRGQVDALTEWANTVALDLPGRGQSGAEGERSIPAYARAVADFIDAIDAPRPIPCGLSLGGGIAQQLLLDYPERFVAGVLIGTGARLRVSGAILEGISSDYEAFVANAGAISLSPKSDRAVLGALGAEMAKCPADVTLGDFLACDAFDVMARLPEIRVPVLIISGEDDFLTPPKYARFLEEHIAGARRVHLDAAGHLSPLEKPAEVNRAIAEFLQTL